ncbi:MAG: rod shape-determining protein RodA [Clostridiales bacterium]|jgi:rod shape determining protein RodA|nr:rod shape-determining protein RodA [Clostridiales bacterium]
MTLIIRRQWQLFDLALLILVCAFAVFGIIMVGTASSFESVTFNNQRLFFLTGIILLITATVMDYHFITKFYIWIYALAILLLIVTMFMPPDETKTLRWIRFGSFSIQPSEFAKLFIIIFLAKFIDMKKDSINNIFNLLLVVVLVALPAFLIMKQPALSACMVIIFISVCILFSAGLHIRYIIGALIILVPLLMIVAWDIQNEERVIINKILNSYQIGRIDTFLNPTSDSDEYYQVNASLHSIGSGMLNGKGFDQDSYIPVATNDFIFSVIGEQFGFIGCSTLLLVMLLIIAKCIIIANRAPDLQGKLIAMGVAGMLAFETIVNVGVVTAILPNTGMPFPFLSSGGSAMWINMAAIGLVLNVGLFKTKSIFEG